jgi:hypothetical protein
MVVRAGEEQTHTHAHTNGTGEQGATEIAHTRAPHARGALSPSVVASPGPSLLLPTTPLPEAPDRGSSDGAPRARRPRSLHNGDAGTPADGEGSTSGWRDVAACLQLCDKMLGALQQDASESEAKPVSQASEFATRSTVGLMLSHTAIEHLVVGGPAYNTGMLGKGDEIIRIDGKDVHMLLQLPPHKHGLATHQQPGFFSPRQGYEQLGAALTGSDVPGTPLKLTVKKFRTGEIREVILTRMATEMIADRRRLFELFTCLKDRAIQDNDTVARHCVDQVIDLWTKMVQAEALRHDQANENLREKQNTLRSGLQAIKAKFPGFNRFFVDAQAHRLELRVTELETALRKSCEENCVLELQSERLRAKLLEHEGMMGHREVLTGSAAALLALQQKEQDLENNRMKEEAETAGALLRAERAVYRTLEQDYTAILSGRNFALNIWRLHCALGRTDANLPKQYSNPPKILLSLSHYYPSLNIPPPPVL